MHAGQRWKRGGSLEDYQKICQRAWGILARLSVPVGAVADIPLVVIAAASTTHFLTEFALSRCWVGWIRCETLPEEEEEEEEEEEAFRGVPLIWVASGIPSLSFFSGCKTPRWQAGAE